MPQFERPKPIVVGSGSEEKKKELQEKILDNFGEKHYDQIPKDKRKILEALEYEKKPYEKLTINKANEITNNLLIEFGLKQFDIPEQNIHIVPGKLFKEVNSSPYKVATTFQDRQLIALNADELINPLNRASTIFHEITHLKNFLSLEAYKDSSKSYRSGLKISATAKKEDQIGFFIAFSGLNEAIVSEIEKRYSPQLLDGNEVLQKELIVQNSKEVQEKKEKIAKERGKNIDEIICSDEDGSCFYPYYEQRRVLNYIVDRLYEDNQEQFKSKDDVMRLFFRAHFDGKLLIIAKFIEKSFGKGSFRMIGMMDDGMNSARLVMDYLKKR